MKHTEGLICKSCVLFWELSFFPSLWILLAAKVHWLTVFNKTLFRIGNLAEGILWCLADFTLEHRYAFWLNYCWIFFSAARMLDIASSNKAAASFSIGEQEFRVGKLPQHTTFTDAVNSVSFGVQRCCLPILCWLCQCKIWDEMRWEGFILLSTMEFLMQKAS